MAYPKMGCNCLPNGVSLGDRQWIMHKESCPEYGKAIIIYDFRGVPHCKFQVAVMEAVTKEMQVTDFFVKV